MKTKIGLLLASLIFAACNTGEQNVGYISLSLPSQRGTFRSQAEDTGFIAAPGVSHWKITISADDIQEPIVVDSSETLVRIPVKSGPARIVRISGRGETVDNITQGFDGETVVDVPEGVDTEAVVDVYRSVTVTDANLPQGRTGAEAPGAPDIHEVTMTLQADSALLIMSFNNDVAAPWDVIQDNSIRGMIELDLDRNAQTGDASKTQAKHRSARAVTGSTVADLPIGVDATIDLSPLTSGYVKLLTGDTSIPVVARFAGRTLSVTIPFENLGGNVTGVRFVSFATDKKGSVDFAPEKDFVQISLVDQAPPVAALRAVSSFTGNFVAAYRDSNIVPLPVLRASPVGMHAAWLSPTGVDYAFSETGKLFGDRTTIALSDKNYVSMGYTSAQNYDLDLAANEKGQPTVVVSRFISDTINYALPSSTTVTVVQAGDGKFLTPFDTNLNLTNNYDPSYLGRAQVVASGDTAIVSDVADYSAHGSEIFTVQNGAKIASISVAVSGNEQSLTMDGLGDFFFNYSGGSAGPAISLNQLALSAGKPVLTFDKYIADNLYFSGLRSAAGGKNTLYTSIVMTTGQFPDYVNTVTVFDQAGNSYLVPDADVSSASYATSIGSFPSIAVSKSGRVGIAWHHSLNPVLMGAPPAMRLAAPASDWLDTIYYSEKLPGAKAFSAPIKVGPGNYVSLAFDALEQPVVLVSSLKTDASGYSVTSSELTSYQGE